MRERGTRAVTLGSDQGTGAVMQRFMSAALLSAMVVPLGAEAAWYAGPPLSVERAEHTATALPSGEVLFCGGTSAALQILATCEIYDPDRGAVRPAASMPVPTGVTSTGGRHRHTAVLLTTGEVLVIGGVAIVSGVTTTVGWMALYTPATDSWRSLASLATDRASATATRLLDGRVAVIGGVRVLPAGGALAARIEIFDPVTGLLSMGPLLASPRFLHTATRLADGRVLIVGGVGSTGNTIAALERFDPATGMLTPIPITPWNPSSLHVSTLLTSGQVFLDGEPNVARTYEPIGNTWTTLPAGTLEVEEMGTVLLGDGRVLEVAGNRATLYEPALNRWTPVTAGLGNVGARFTLTRLASGQVMLAGGTGGGNATRSTWVFDPEARGAVDLGVPLLTAARSGHTANLLPAGDVLFWGGVEQAGASNVPAAEIYDPVARGLTPLLSVTTYRRSHATVDLNGGKVLVAGGVECGFSCSGAILASAELFDPVTRNVAALAPMSQTRSRFTLTRLTSGEVLAAGGLATVQAETFDPATMAWSAAGTMASRRGGHTATLLGDGSVIVAGGQDGAIRHATVEQFQPATRTWRARRAMAVARESHTATPLSDTRVLIAGGLVGSNAAVAMPTTSAVIYDAATDTYTPIADMRAARSGHTATVLAGGCVLVTGGSSAATAAEVWCQATGAWLEVLDNAASSQLGRGNNTLTTLASGEHLSAGGVFSQASDFMTLFRLGEPIRPTLVRPAQPLAAATAVTFTGTGLIPTSEGHFGRTEASASDVPIVRALALSSGILRRQPARAFTPTRLTLTTPAGSLGHHLLLAGLGGTAGGTIVRFGNLAPVATSLMLTTPEDTPVDLRLIGGDRDGDDVTFTLATMPTRGRFSGTAPVLTYQPDADANGREQVQVAVSDGRATTTAMLTIDVAPVNDAPRVASDAYVMDEDTRLTTTASTGVLANDVDVDSTTLTVRADTGGVMGTLSVRADGSFDYAPAAEWSGRTTFRYDVFDGDSASTDVTVSIDVRPVPDAPVTRPDLLAATEDRTTVIEVGAGLLVNDADADGDRLRAMIVRTSSRATVTVSLDGAVTYAPQPNFHGRDTFTYVATDGVLTSTPTEVVVQVANVNDPPEVQDDAFTVDPRRALVVTATAGVLVNDTDVDGDPLQALLQVPPLHGTLVLERDGGFRFSAEPGYAGMDAFEYTADDRQGGRTRGRVVLVIAEDTPTGTADRYAVDEDTVLVVDAARGLLANDGSPRVIAELATSPEHGAVEIEPDGSFVYQSATDYAGMDTFTYRASRGSAVSEPIAVVIEVRPINDQPEPPEPRLPIDMANLVDGRVVFTWTPARDVDDTRLTYRVDVQAQGANVLTLATPETSIDVAGDQVLAPGVYTWTVEATDGDNLKSGPSTLRTFTIGGDGGAPPDEGCGCATTPSPKAPWWLLIVALGALLRRKVWLAGALSLAACSNSNTPDAAPDASECAPRSTRACACDSGAAGMATCAAWGQFAECVCTAGADGGDAAPDVGTFEDARADAAPDAGLRPDADSGEVDSGEVEDSGEHRDAEPTDTGDAGPTDTGPPMWCTSFPAGYVAPLVPDAFGMGSPMTELGTQPNERPRHDVIFNNPFWIATMEVTQAEWDRVMPTNPSRTPCAQCPVENVSWDEAVDYVNALSASCGLPSCFPAASADRRTFVLDLTCTGFRLPTEAEWEYAARGDTQTAFWSGEATQELGVEPALDGVAWYSGTTGGQLRPVATLRPNAYGLYDVHGNAAEWVADGLRTYTIGTPIDIVAHPMSAYPFVLRGGHAGSTPRDCRAAARRGDTNGAAVPFAGLRVARTR